MKTFLFLLNNGHVIQTNNKNVQLAYNHLVELGLVNSLHDFCGVHMGKMNDIAVEISSINLKELIEESYPKN